MTDVTFTNSRADSSANEDLTTLARHGADAFGYRAHLRIERKLAQLLRLRVSQINNCAYCLNLHYEAARDAGIRVVLARNGSKIGDGIQESDDVFILRDYPIPHHVLFPRLRAAVGRCV